MCADGVDLTSRSPVLIWPSVASRNYANRHASHLSRIFAASDSNSDPPRQRVPETGFPGCVFVPAAVAISTCRSHDLVFGTVLLNPPNRRCSGRSGSSKSGILLPLGHGFKGTVLSDACAVLCFCRHKWPALHFGYVSFFSWTSLTVRMNNGVRRGRSLS